MLHLIFFYSLPTFGSPCIENYKCVPPMVLNARYESHKYTTGGARRAEHVNKVEVEKISSS